MKTLTDQLIARRNVVKKLGGQVPAARGGLERQLHEVDREIRLLQETKKRPATVESYRLMGLTESEARIAAQLESGVKRRDVNQVFESALAAAKELGLTEAEAKVFANPGLSEEEIQALRLSQHLTVADAVDATKK